MEDYISSSKESSSSASSAGEDDIDDEFLGHSQNSKGSSNHSGMQQSIIDQSSLYRCPFCCFQTTIEIVMREHLNFHFIKSVHQCQLCSFSIGTVPELYLHIQRHHLIADHSDIKMNNRSTGEKSTRRRSATFKCGQCEFVTKYKQELQRHEIRHKEKCNFQCKLCSYSVSSSYYLNLHLKRHHYALAPTQEVSVEPATPLTVQTEGVSVQQIKTDPPSTVPSEEALLEEVRTEPPIPPPADQVQLQPVKLNKWRVESIQAPKRRGGSCLVSKLTEVVNRAVKGPKPARRRLAQRSMTAHKASKRSKRLGLMFNQARNGMKKKKPKPQETGVVNTTNNALKKKKKKLIKKKPKSLVDAADLAGLPVSKPEEPVESATYYKKQPKRDVYKQEETEFKCTECEFNTLHWGNMKRHIDKHDRREKFKCDRCSYSAGSKTHLSRHSNRFHREQPAAPRLNCSDCEYSTLRWDTMKCHRLHHEQEEEFKCDRCSFSARLKIHVSAHSNRFHRAPPAALVEVKKENDCDRKKVMRDRIENMKVKVSTAELEKKQILAQKKDVQEKIKKMEKKKLKTELVLRKLMEKQQNSSDPMDLNQQNRVIRIQQKTSRLQDRERKLRSLEQEERNLDEEEKNAEDSLIGAKQVLLALESELIKVEV